MLHSALFAAITKAASFSHAHEISPRRSATRRARWKIKAQRAAYRVRRVGSILLGWRRSHRPYGGTNRYSLAGTRRGMISFTQQNEQERPYWYSGTNAPDLTHCKALPFLENCSLCALPTRPPEILLTHPLPEMPCGCPQPCCQPDAPGRGAIFRRLLSRQSARPGMYNSGRNQLTSDLLDQRLKVNASCGARGRALQAMEASKRR